MTTYRYTIYSYTKHGNLNVKRIHYRNFTDNVRTAMNQVKRLRSRYKNTRIKKMFTVKFEKLISV